jgi:hypothetical protein
MEQALIDKNVLIPIYRHADSIFGGARESQAIRIQPRKRANASPRRLRIKPIDRRQLADHGQRRSKDTRSSLPAVPDSWNEALSSNVLGVWKAVQNVGTISMHGWSSSILVVGERTTTTAARGSGFRPVPCCHASTAAAEASHITRVYCGDVCRRHDALRVSGLVRFRP